MSADAHEAAIPLEARLADLILGEGSAEFWLPQAANEEQIEATIGLAKAVRDFEHAFGLESTVRQLGFLITVSRTLARKNAAMTRVLQARAEIAALAADARRSGDEARARDIESRPTPDYPGKAEDDKELGYAGN